jgi:3D (Asp-Asp-Asp) domain-containing protein
MKISLILVLIFLLQIYTTFYSHIHLFSKPAICDTVVKSDSASDVISIPESCGGINVHSPVVARVTVTTYNSTPEQTNGDPTIGAFNVKVGPGSVAVSRDLLEMGFTPFSKIWVEGLGEFVVHDLTSSRLRTTIDVWQPLHKRNFKLENVLAVRYCVDPKISKHHSMIGGLFELTNVDASMIKK